MEPVIELRSEMRVRPWKLWAGCVLLTGLVFVSGLWIGRSLVNPSELNRQEAESVAYDVFQECDKQFIPHGKDLWSTQMANEKCQKLFNFALDSGGKKREKKR